MIATTLTCYCHNCQWAIVIEQITECENICPSCGSTSIGLSIFGVMEPEVRSDYQPRSHFVITGGDSE